MPADFTTRVYKYGAVPLGPFPEEGVEGLWRDRGFLIIGDAIIGNPTDRCGLFSETHH